jgi:hypothetical protein
MRMSPAQPGRPDDAGRSRHATPGGPAGDADPRAPPLSAITVIGGSRITAQALRGPSLSVSIAGPSDVRIDRVEGEQLAVSLMGSGRLAIGGAGR